MKVRNEDHPAHHAQGPAAALVGDRALCPVVRNMGVANSTSGSLEVAATKGACSHCDVRSLVPDRDSGDPRRVSGGRSRDLDDSAISLGATSGFESDVPGDLPQCSVASRRVVVAVCEQNSDSLGPCAWIVVSAIFILLRSLIFGGGSGINDRIDCSVGSDGGSAGRLCASCFLASMG